VVIRTGVVLPTFRYSPDDAFAAAAQAFAAGVDGVFCYDHIWPLGQPDRPALAPFPVLAALAADTSAPATPGGGPFYGTLVARVGLVPDEVLLDQFTALAHLAPGRIVAGLGTGDRLSEAENRAYGIPFPSAAERRAEMVDLAQALRRAGLTTWIAGGPAARTTEARAAGAALNVWDADPALVLARAHGPDAVEVTWAGPPPGSEGALEARVTAVAGAGATWVVFGWPVDLDVLAAAARGRAESGHA
jgi:alkanesulfonate monooxygenase SsuD/methylene tetrahydromethanopterin reductase-like flavin-dependent oxidoreductase (luciferase family)